MNVEPECLAEGYAFEVFARELDALRQKMIVVARRGSLPDEQPQDHNAGYALSSPSADQGDDAGLQSVQDAVTDAVLLLSYQGAACDYSR